MFGLFKKKQKSDLEKLIEKDGIEYAAKRFSEIILQKIPTADITYQFVLEEIEAASQGNDTAISFARNCGISPQEYKGSMSNSRPEVDGPDGPQQFLLALCMQLQPNVDLVVELRTKIVDNIMKTLSLGKYESQKSSPLKGGMRLDEAEVDILFIVNDGAVIYINDEAGHLFEIDKDGDEKLEGRVVNFVFSGQSTGTVIEVFVAFDDSDSYTMFTLQTGTVERLNYVAQAIFKYFAENGIQDVFSPIEQYATQYVYTFKLYRKSEKYFMVNNSQTQAYLIDGPTILRDDADEIKRIFWD
ncbi:MULTISPECIES: hypothetical protein [unclassified Vibrio]|uniref:hypothetical protein n=1 Tax=unclassified Vibrio TaxID=2614977 RepID=UPI0035501065